MTANNSGNATCITTAVVEDRSFRFKSFGENGNCHRQSTLLILQLRSRSWLLAVMVSATPPVVFYAAPSLC